MSQTVVQLEKIREKLLDLGLRGNSLLHFAPRGKKHIDIIDEKSSEIFKIIAQQEKKMSFLPSPEIFHKEDEDSKDYNLPTLEEYLVQEKGDARHTDLHLQTKLRPEELDTRLLRIDNEAKTIFQERGIDVLYLALGFLKWYEDPNSKKERFSPIVLVPVELNRAAAGKGFKLSYTGMDLTENETLYAKVKNDFNVELPRGMQENQVELDLDSYFENISEAIKGLGRFEVIEDKISLGFFSFGKFQMYKDLDAKIWPEGEKPGQKEILEFLFEKGFDSNDLDQKEVSRLETELLSPERLNLVKDADSTQTEAILRVVSGQNLIIQGPPGTGKSQTITNLISEAISRDKKVLFVAQKLTALEVVKFRLDQAHIGQSVLELHSHKSRPRDVLDSLEQTLFEDSPESPERDAEKVKLREIKSYLDSYANLLKDKLQGTRFSFGQALGNYIRLKSRVQDINDLPDFDTKFYTKFGDNEWESFHSDLDLIFKKLSTIDSLRDNPYFGTRAIDISPELVDQVKSMCTSTLDLMDKRDELVNEVNNLCDLDIPANSTEFDLFFFTLELLADSALADQLVISSKILKNHSFLNELIELVRRFSDLQSKCNSVFEREALETQEAKQIMDTKKALEIFGPKWYRFFKSDYRKAKKIYSSFIIAPGEFQFDSAVEKLNLLIDYHRSKTDLLEEKSAFEDLFGEKWRGIKSDLEHIESSLEFALKLNGLLSDNKIPRNTWELVGNSKSKTQQLKELALKIDSNEQEIRQLAEEINSILKEKSQETDFSNLKLQLKTRARSTQPLFYIVQLNSLLDRLKHHKADQLIDIIYQFTGNYFHLKDFIEFSFWSVILNCFYNEKELIKKFDRSVHEKFIDDFVALDSYTFVYAQEHLVQYLHEKLPSPSAPGEMSMLRREMQKKRRLLPVRRLLERAGPIIQAIKPVFMMSPMSVATFLPPGKLNFDLVIFDEASQVPIPDSIGAMLRGSQIVVVGDSKQMPPTNFFSRSVDVSDEDLEDDYTAEIESVLDLFSAQGAKESMLKWHYRSKHESLIYTSNKEFYDGKLFVFPSSGTNGIAKGLDFEYTEGSVYDRSGKRINQLEAKRVAERVKEHVENHPDLSLGVVAFSMAQKEAIMFEVEYLRRSNPHLEFFFNDEHNDEPFFVKNLENVQGDERDIIFISVGYGWTQHGKLSKNFGPINKAGGERRLNVLMSRSKQQMIVFSNFKAEDLSTDAQSPHGVRVLKSFLKYAQTGVVDIPKETDKEADSIFEIEVAKRITELGYEIEHQVGSQGFYIDIAVRHPKKPGIYLAAIECDGASYHSSANARDRDRLRQSVLESAGWNFHRIWSTDWFRDEKAEIERLRERLEGLLSKESSELDKKETPKPQISRIEKDFDSSAHHQYVQATLRKSEKYNEWYSYDYFEDIPENQIKSAIEDIIEIESPLHRELIYNRIIGNTSFNRVGARIKSKIDRLIDAVTRGEDFIEKKGFIQKKWKKVIVRDRTNLPVAEKKYEMIPTIELKTGIKEVIGESVSLELTDLAKEVLNRVGIKALRSSTKDQFELVVNQLVKEGTLIKVDTKYSFS